jgi:NAD(P)-dependent dehydrogenase (short-subunit alcohol dehydrogenase family)
MKLQNQTAIVTGAGRGIGRAIALAFAREGANVTLAARTSAEIETVAEEIRALGGKALAVATDVASKASVQGMVAQTIDGFGRVDILVNNAGVAGTSPIAQITEELWDLNIAVNLKGVFLCTQAVFTHMCDRRSGHIVNVTSLSDRYDGANYGAYGAAKWGARGFTGITRTEGRPFGVKATVVAPGPVDTKMRRDHHRDEGAKLGQPEDVADLVMLAVTQSAAVTTHDLALHTTSNPELEMLAHWE